MLTELHIGIDDTDSKLGGCTTYTAALLFEELCSRGFKPADYPWLVRLNPNIPWKTRGNGALAIHLLVDQPDICEIRELALDIVGKTTDPSQPSTDPAVVFLEGKVPAPLRDFSTRALHDVIHIDEARRVSRIIGACAYLFKGSRGLIGALSAIGSGLNADHTFEIIAYRTKDNLGTPRRVDQDSVKAMETKYGEKTFNNIDPETGRILICPHGPDPVLFGIRGEDPASLLDAFEELRVYEPIERVMVFKTNHGTDAHLTRESSIQTLRPHQSAVVMGVVETCPTVLRGGHVFFRLCDEEGSVECAAYEPTASLRKAVLELRPGDRVRVLGGIRRGPGEILTLNIEKLEILELTTPIIWRNPRCLECESSCESMGRHQGFRCRRCARRYPDASKIPVPENRNLKPALYIPPPRAHRHLTKPAGRYYRPIRTTVDQKISMDTILGTEFLSLSSLKHDRFET